MPVVKFHIVKWCSSNAALSSPPCLIQGGTFFLSDVLSELKTMNCGESLSNHDASTSHTLHLLKTKVSQFFPKHSHRFLKSCENEESCNYSQDSQTRYGCHFKEICTNMNTVEKFLLWFYSAGIRFTSRRQAWTSFIKCQIFLSFNN